MTRQPRTLAPAAGFLCLALAAACTASEPWTLTLPQPGLRAASGIHEISSYDRAAVAIAEIFEGDLERES